MNRFHMILQVIFLTPLVLTMITTIFISIMSRFHMKLEDLFLCILIVPIITSICYSIVNINQKNVKTYLCYPLKRSINIYINKPINEISKRYSIVLYKKICKFCKCLKQGVETCIDEASNFCFRHLQNLQFYL